MKKPHSAGWQLQAPGQPTFGPLASIMGIVNVTPDSFSDGGLAEDTRAAIAHGQALVSSGAEWLDIGGESSRPGAQPVAAALERQRVVPVIAGLRAAGVTVPISVDTWKAEVAEAAIAAGATLVNDITAGRDPEMLPLVAQHRVGVCLMHMQGEPSTMQEAPHYQDVVAEVIELLAEAMAKATAAGIADAAVVLDPGIGFGKTHQHNWQLLRGLEEIGQALQRPLLVGISRKRLIGHLMGEESAPRQRDHASHLLHAQLFDRCAILRVHDVAGARLARRLCLANTQV